MLSSQIDVTQSAMLDALKDGELSTRELARRMEVSESWVSRIGRRLEAAGKVRRRRANDLDDVHTTWTMWRAT